MTKAVLFDFDETLQDRTAAFEKYMDAFMAAFLSDLSEEEKKKRKKIWLKRATAAMLTEKNGIRALSICGIEEFTVKNGSCKSL